MDGHNYKCGQFAFNESINQLLKYIHLKREVRKFGTKIKHASSFCYYDCILSPKIIELVKINICIRQDSSYSKFRKQTSGTTQALVYNIAVIT